ncbi:MAG: endoribonuclease ysh1 [Chaenotheca gracillima]|nr:MAG: endoribonuclease ysh1 [Chaenotheca gracillima]
MSPSAILDEGPTTYSSSKKRIPPRGSAVLHRDLNEAPPRVHRALGSYITLTNGQRVLDATGGAAVSCLGHGNERVKKAIVAQMNEVSYCHTSFFTTSGAEGLARELVDSTHGHMARAFIVNSGSEAMEGAMKLARQYYLELSTPQPDRFRFIARRESYHGTTLGALSMSGHVARRRLFEPMLLDVVSRVSPCNPYRGMTDQENTKQYVERLAQELDGEFQRVGPQTVCAFVAEPTVGAALGCVPAVKGYFKAMKAVCNKYGALLIFDEVMCGMGRTGALHAWELEGVVPDIQTIGKGLSGGYAPVAGILMGQKIVDALENGSGGFVHGHTYQGHPTSCAAALEVQRIVREENLVQNVQLMGAYLSKSLRAKLCHHPHVGDIRGKGLFLGIEFVKDRASKTPFDPRHGVANVIHSRAMDPEYSISLYPGAGSVDGVSGDHIIISPAYNVTKAEIDAIVDTTVAVIDAVFSQMEFS